MLLCVHGRTGPRRRVIMGVVLAAIAVGASAAWPARAQGQQSDAPREAVETDADADTRVALRLMREGKFREAAVAAERAAASTEALHGADSLKTAVARHNLGLILSRDKRPTEGLPLLERALAVYETLLPAVHEDIANVTAEIGQIYVASGRARDLADIYARHIARAGREGHGAHVNAARLLANQGFVLRGLKRADDSEAAFVRAATIYEDQGAIASESYLTTLEAVLDRLQQTKRIEAAQAKVDGAIAAFMALGDRGRPFAVVLNNRQSMSALETGRSGVARAYAQAALALLEGNTLAPLPGRVDSQVAALNNLARAYRGLANYAGAEDAYRRSIALLEARGDKRNAGIVTDNLAVLFMHQGRLEESERLAKRGLALLEESLGRNHPTVGQSAANLGALLNEAGRPLEAEPLLRRALAIVEAQPTPNLVLIGIIEDNLAGVLRISGRRQEARAHYERAIGNFERALPKTHPRIATSRNNFGRYLLDLGRLPEAEAELKTALSLSEEIYGAESFNIAIPSANLAEVFTAMKRYEEGRALFVRAIAALEAVYGRRHANIQVTLNSAAKLELADGKANAARALYEQSVAIEVQKRARAGVRAFAGSQFEARRAFHGLLEALWHEGVGDRAQNATRALEVAQLDSATPAAVALAALGARAGASDPALGVLTRERQDLAAEWVAVDKRLTQILSDTGPRNTEAEAQSRARLTAIEARLEGIDADLVKRFPRYHELARPSPLAIDDLRRLIGAGEAVLQFTVTNDVTHVFAITHEEVRWYRAPIQSLQLRTLVRNLRCGLDRAEWAADAGKRCATLLGIARAAAPGPHDPLPFDLVGAHNLYKVLLEPIADTLGGRDLLVVASEALTSLPLHVLLTEPPHVNGSAATINDTVTMGAETGNATLPWLGRRHAITVLPSLPSLAPLRRLAKASAGSRPYVGIGNPLLTGPEGTDRRAFEVPSCRIGPNLQEVAAVSLAPQSRPPSSVVRSAMPTGGLLATKAASAANLDTLRQQWPLPETADELCRVAGFAGAEANDVIVGARATEAQIKSMSAEGLLSQARILHFATHGLLAGETAQFLADKVEPSLMLTPPASANDVDDGLLTASEVAALKLDADWVVLSACNTASGDDVGAEALSGLARAFFYAGARSLLVSHWAVDSDATVKLITTAFDAMARNPGMTHGRALSTAMAALIAGGGREAHPENWAPFVVVGGGIAGVTASPKGVAAGAAANVTTPAVTSDEPVTQAPVPATAGATPGVKAQRLPPDKTTKKPNVNDAKKAKTAPKEPDWTTKLFQ